MEEKTFIYKLDFYYQQALIYLSTFIAYAAIRGSFIEDRFDFVFRDPILYVIVAFTAVSFVVLFLNIWRKKRLVITDDKLVFSRRSHERVYRIADIAWMHIGRERMVQTAGIMQQATIKFKGRPLSIRIRVGRYEKDRELLAELERIEKRVPHGHRRRFPFRRRRSSKPE